MERGEQAAAVSRRMRFGAAIEVTTTAVLDSMSKVCLQLSGEPQFEEPPQLREGFIDGPGGQARARHLVLNRDLGDLKVPAMHLDLSLEEVRAGVDALVED